MMKKLLVIILLLISTSAIFSQTPYMPYGGIFTPRGDLRILIICAGFGPNIDGNPGYYCDGWPTGTGTFPESLQNKKTFYYNNADFTNNQLNSDINVSKFFYESSFSQFKLIADTVRVNINPAGANSWGSLNRKVMEKLRIDRPTFNWSRFDSRRNVPNYLFDNRTMPPDSFPDYVIVIYRYVNPRGDTNSIWYRNPPVANMHNWTNATAYAALDGLNGFVFNGYRFNYYCGYTQCVGSASLFGVFIHELGHNLYEAQHYGNGNDVVGDYYYGQIGGWGGMKLGGSAPFSTYLAWERWYLDYCQIRCNNVNSSINTAADLPPDGKFTLRDYQTTGDMVRIKIPNISSKNNYLWLENHRGKSIFDKRYWLTNGCGQPFPGQVVGLCAYVEAINDNKSKIVGWANNPNGIFYLNGKGNFDYTYSGNKDKTCHLWNNWIYSINEGKENPYAGQSRSECIRWDYDNNGKISFDNNANSPSYNEHQWLVKRNGAYTYDFFGIGANFVSSKRLGISSNPPLTNYPLFNSGSQNFAPFILNGIQIDVVTQNSDGSVDIKVKYNQVDIANDYRMAGNIELPDITGNSSVDLNLLSNKILTIDLSGTPDRTGKINGTFTNPSVFRCKANSYFKMNSNSNVIVCQGSTLVLETGSKLEIEDGATLYIKAGSRFEVQNGATIIIKGSGKIEVECNGNMCSLGNPVINLQNLLSLINLHTGCNNSVTGCNSTISKTSGNGSVNDFRLVPVRNISGITISFDSFYFGKIINCISTMVINTGTDVFFSAEQEVNLQNDFEMQVGTTLTIDFNPNPCQ